MSIKNFHTVFIIFAILADGAFAVYLTWLAPETLKEQAGPVGLLSGILALALIAYLPFHIRKARHIIV